MAGDKVTTKIGNIGNIPQVEAKVNGSDVHVSGRTTGGAVTDCHLTDAKIAKALKEVAAFEKAGTPKFKTDADVDNYYMVQAPAINQKAQNVKPSIASKCNWER